MDTFNRITTNPQQCGGRPCVRGMRIRVSDVLDLLDAGLSREAILAEIPDLEADDIAACLHFAQREAPPDADGRRPECQPTTSR